jgi:hypothetical protein
MGKWLKVSGSTFKIPHAPLAVRNDNTDLSS